MVNRGFGVEVTGAVPVLVSLLSRAPARGAGLGMRPGCSPFHRYARAGVAGYSMIAGCSPRYSRVTTRDHEHRPLLVPPGGYGKGEKGEILDA
jgi:hypothetical protein